MSQPIELGPYIGGVNLIDPVTKLSDNELSQCLNLRTGTRGDFYKRPGFGTYGSSPAKVNGDVLVNLALRYYKVDGTKLLIAAAGGKLRKGNDVTGAWTDISINGSGASMEATKLADWMVYKNRLYITDGINPQRYNITDDIYAGHFIHAAPTLAQTTGGSLTLLSTYKYFVASVAGDMGEGPKGAEATITLTGSNNRVNLTVMADAAVKHEETAKRIYRTKAGGSLFYFLAEIPEGTTIYNDLLADSALGAEYVPTHAPRSDSRFVVMGHDERAYWSGRSGLNASTVEVSDVGFPDRIRDADGFFTVANNDGDVLTGSGLVPGGIVFFKRTSLWLSRAFGYGLINIYPKDKRGAGVGCTAPFSIVSTPVGLIFLSQRGEVYKFDGTNIIEVGRRIYPEFRGMTEAAMNRIVACYHDYRYIISYDYRGSKGYNWKTMEYDPFLDKWEGPNENGDIYTPSYYSVWDSVLDKGELYWGEGRAVSGSYVYGRTEFTKLDRGIKFVSTARSGARALGRLSEVKSYKVFVHGEVSGDANIKFSHIDERNSRTSVDLSTGVPIAGSILDAATTVFNTIKLGGSISQVMEGSLGPSSRSRTPIYEITDGGTATEVRFNEMQLLAEALPLK